MRGVGLVAGAVVASVAPMTLQGLANAGASGIAHSASVAPNASAYVPITPTRILDTRTGPGRFASGSTNTITVGGLADVPNDGSVVAVAVSLTFDDPSGSGYVETWASGGRPLASTATTQAGVD